MNELKHIFLFCLIFFECDYVVFDQVEFKVKGAVSPHYPLHILIKFVMKISYNL